MYLVKNLNITFLKMLFFWILILVVCSTFALNIFQRFSDSYHNLPKPIPTKFVFIKNYFFIKQKLSGGICSEYREEGQNYRSIYRICFLHYFTIGVFLKSNILPRQYNRPTRYYKNTINW